MTFPAGGSHGPPAFLSIMILSIMKRAGGSHMRGLALISVGLSDKLR